MKGINTHLCSFPQVKNMPLGADVEFCSSYDPDHTEVDDTNPRCELRCKQGFRLVFPVDVTLSRGALTLTHGRLLVAT